MEKEKFKIGDIVKVLRKRDWNSRTGEICKIVNTINNCKQDMSDCRTVYLCVNINDNRHNEKSFYAEDLEKI